MEDRHFHVDKYVFLSSASRNSTVGPAHRIHVFSVGLFSTP